MKVSIVIPCYNEEKILPYTLNRLENFSKRYFEKGDCQLIFVDDGSNDKTYQILQNYPNINLVSYNDNMGKGYAVRQGILRAKHNTIVILDADLSVKPENILNIGKYRKPTLIMGIRKQVKKQPLYRILVGKGYQILVGLIFQHFPFDTQCPFKVLINIDKKYIRDLKINGFSYDVELYQKLKDKVRVIKTKVEYHNVSDTKVTIIKVIVMFIDLLRIKFIR